MKASEIEVGKTYLCRIGEELAQVVVIAHYGGEFRISGKRGPERFRVRRKGKENVLPRLRTAAALRPIPPPEQTPGIDRENEWEHLTRLDQKPPTTVSQEAYSNACKEYLGWCIYCKEFTREETEPDARGYICPQCEQPTVYGAEWAMVSGYIEPQCKKLTVDNYSTE